MRQLGNETNTTTVYSFIVSVAVATVEGAANESAFYALRNIKKEPRVHKLRRDLSRVVRDGVSSW